MSKTEEIKSQMQSIVDHATQAVDGLLTNYEAFNAIRSIMAGMDLQALHDEHVRLLSSDEPEEPEQTE